LRGLVNGATSKVTELETSITREFTNVKKKNEDSLNAVKAEFTKGVDGLTSKITSLEEYKNQDGTRTENLKQWVQRDTASQLSRERTEINRIIDNKGFVKNTEFSSKFTESARGIINQLSALETYKNQDGARTANLQIWVQNNTANQLTAARRSIESWVNEKGYATTSVVENKVQETANSFSREISNVRNSIPTSVGGRNYITDSKKLDYKFLGSWDKWEKSVSEDILILTKVGGNDTTGFFINLTDILKTEFQNETLTWSIDIKASRNATFNTVGFETNGQKRVDITTKWQRISHTFINKFTNYFAFTFYHPTTNFNNGDKIYIKLPKLEKGNVATDWTPAPEDVEQNVNELNTWKQTANQTLNTVTSTLNDTVRHSQLRVGADKIDFGSNQVFDGRNLASMLSVSPESINAITDKLVITPSNENLVRVNQRESITSSERDTFITDDIKEDLSDGAEFYFKAKFSSNGRGKQRIGIHIYVTYTDNSQSWGFTEMFPINSYAWSEERTATLKFGKTAGKKVKHYAFGIHQSAWNDFSSWTIKELELYKKKSAELIVDGSIEGRQIKTNTLETGHHKAGSITSEIIAANAVKAKHVLIDDGLIHNLLTHNAFINKLWAQQAFINKLNAVKIRSTQIDTDTLNGVVISGQSKIKIGQYGFLQPIEKGLQINAPENFGSKRGIGLQIAGEGVGPKESGVPPGLFIYEDPDFTRGNTVPSAVNRVLLTVAGMACFSSRILGSVVKGQPILTNLDYSSPFSNHAPVKFIGYKEGGFMRFFSTANSNSDIWNIKVDQWGSDRKLKTDIKDSEFNAIEFVEKLNFKDHGWNKDEIGYEKPHTKCGLIAQEVQELDESLVVDYETYLGLDGLRLINIALKAIQELSQQNKKLKNKLEELING
ncbi:tail fiber domain-containing protein, partial [uncultured Gemella sp.]|uniref:tail fiber domain-containing protein n=1 Tax=uncultured Gemella sp. TaxID=254352 RepID=UPI0028EF1869